MNIETIEGKTIANSEKIATLDERTANILETIEKIGDSINKMNDSNELRHEEVRENLHEIRNNMITQDTYNLLSSAVSENKERIQNLEKEIAIGLWFMKNKKTVIFACFMVGVFVVTQSGLDYEAIKTILKH